MCSLVSKPVMGFFLNASQLCMEIAFNFRITRSLIILFLRLNGNYSNHIPIYDLPEILDSIINVNSEIKNETLEKILITETYALFNMML